MVGIELVLGKLFDEIGFHQIEDELFRDLVLYRLVYPIKQIKNNYIFVSFCTKNVLSRLLVSEGGYPLAYEIFEGKQYEGHTMLPIINGFKDKYKIQKIVVVVDSGLLSKDNIAELIRNNYEFILGARIKNETEQVKSEILALKIGEGESATIIIDDLKLIITYAKSRAKKDKYNRDKGIKRLDKNLKSGKLIKTSFNNRGYNKFLLMTGDIQLCINQDKIKEDEKWEKVILLIPCYQKRRY